MLGDTLVWMEWFLLFSTVTLSCLTVWYHYAKGPSHEFSQFTLFALIPSMAGWAILLMISGMHYDSRTLNPERFAKFMQDASPAICGPVTVKWGEDKKG